MKCFLTAIPICLVFYAELVYASNQSSIQQKKASIINVSGQDPVYISSWAHRKGKYLLVNETPYVINMASVTHRSSLAGRESKILVSNIEPGFCSQYQSFNYHTGTFSPFDYWKLKVSYLIDKNGHYEEEEWANADKQYCSISANDNGIVKITLIEKDYVVISFSNSSSCGWHLNKIENSTD